MFKHWKLWFQKKKKKNTFVRVFFRSVWVTLLISLSLSWKASISLFLSRNTLSLFQLNYMVMVCPIPLNFNELAFLALKSLRSECYAISLFFFSFFSFPFSLWVFMFMNALYNLLGASSDAKKKKKKNRYWFCKNLDFGFGFCRFIFIFINYCIQLSEIMIDFETHLLVILIGVLRVVKLYTYLLDSFWNLDFITGFGTGDVCLILQWEFVCVHAHLL